MQKEKWKGTFKQKSLPKSPQKSLTNRKLQKWKFVETPLGAGIECPKCGYKIKARDVTFGRYDLNTCSECHAELDITECLLDEMRDESRVRQHYV